MQSDRRRDTTMTDPSHQPSSRRKTQCSKPTALALAVVLGLLIAAGVMIAWFLVLSPENGATDELEAATTQEIQGENETLLPVASSNPFPSSTPVTTMPTSAMPTTQAPTLSLRPSDGPSSSPSDTIVELFVPPNPVPDNPPRSYFNYNIQDTQYGPSAWGNVDMSGTYWSEFGEDGFGPWREHLSDSVRDPARNRCGQQGKQSPVNLTPFESNNVECTAIHQIRTRSGRLPISSDLIQKRFEPNALRIQLNRRPCLNFNNNECKINRPPLADFPNYSSQVTHNTDLMHVDIKTGEHTIDGQRFDAELQLMHMHLDDPRVAYIGIPVQAQDGAYHEPFQVVLDQFQLVYDQHQMECSTRRKLRSTDIPTPIIDPDMQRRLQSRTFFDPYSDFLETVFFYRYNGSSPDPPCYPVTWFVMTTPMFIGRQQLRQLKQLLFTHVDSDCQPTSVHNVDQSVARPTQKLGEIADTGEARTVMLCKEGDFDPDSDGE